MSLKIKLYFTFIVLLIFAQIALAAENFINFHHEQRNYGDDKKVERTPNQIEEEQEHKVELKNPEMEIQVDVHKFDQYEE
tara:strand:+ start:9632 stop:9871 length:240 start_codon:yes stop_codon:yes gene_type:complete